MVLTLKIRINNIKYICDLVLHLVQFHLEIYGLVILLTEHKLTLLYKLSLNTSESETYLLDPPIIDTKMTLYHYVW